ncbi:hypothetical protein V6N12_063780 [Hibiscus sabdariffa]|uniref:Uncharacterized protein n=1 Tax=Hibiscus sabdariffa TaxID=183260 RepID=A0ABR1Z795_9ROSI
MSIVEPVGAGAPIYWSTSLPRCLLGNNTQETSKHTDLLNEPSSRTTLIERAITSRIDVIVRMKMMAELLEKKKGKNLQLTKKAKEAISALITVDKRDGSGNGWKVASGPSANDTM